MNKTKNNSNIQTYILNQQEFVLGLWSIDISQIKADAYW